MYDALERAWGPAVAPAPVVPPTTMWRPVTRIAFRFCATYFILYVVSTQMINR